MTTKEQIEKSRDDIEEKDSDSQIERDCVDESVVAREKDEHDEDSQDTADRVDEPEGDEEHEETEEHEDEGKDALREMIRQEVKSAVSAAVSEAVTEALKTMREDKDREVEEATDAESDKFRLAEALYN